MAAAPGTAASKMHDFLGTCTPEQIGELMQVLQATQDKNAAGGVRDAAATMTVKAGVTAKRTGKKYRNKKAKLARADGGPKRPLNSWMAFRKYYNGSLAPNTQKAISKVLTIMWRADPFEAKWAMLAKAYSVVRGSREKEDAPLDEFLGLCGPLIGVIPPEQYRDIMGWQLTPADQDDKEKVPNLTRVFVPDFPAELITTTLSVDDLVQRCNAAGFIKDGGEETVDRNASGALTMAVQPTNTLIGEVSERAETSNGGLSIISKQDPAQMPLSPTEAAFENALRAALEEAPTEATTLADATIALNDSCSQWPHNAVFDPTAEVSVTFNPNAGLDVWHGSGLSTGTTTDVDWDSILEFESA